MLSNIKYRLLINLIALSSVTFSFGNSIVRTFVDHNPESMFSFYLVLFVAVVFGTVMSAIDYAVIKNKEAQK